MLARRHDTSAVQLVERPQIAMAGPLGIKTSGSNLTLSARSEGRLGVESGPSSRRIGVLRREGRSHLPGLAAPDERARQIGSQARRRLSLKAT
jgi:hypothetical protein